MKHFKDYKKAITTLAGKLLVYTPTSVRNPAKLVAKLNILSNWLGKNFHFFLNG
jgi:hypothetical protein